MDIRLMDQSDLKAYRTIRLNALKNAPTAFCSSYEEESSFSDERFLERLGNENANTFGAFRNEELVGMCSLVFQSREKVNHRADIYSMYVEPYVRRIGVGRMLVTRAIETARENEKTEQIYLTVVRSNKAARTLYELLGFKTYGIERRAMKYGGVYYDHALMVLFLRNV